MAISLEIESVIEPGYDSRIPTHRPTKRMKHKHIDADDQDEQGPTFVARHPLGVRPSGNAFASDVNLKSSMGLFARLPDELLASFLETLASADLLRLGGTCRALHAFTRNEELWRALFIDASPTKFTWRGTWRSTFLDQPADREPAVDCRDLFSDVLHRPFLCANISLDSYAEDIPHSNRIARFADLTPEKFDTEWAHRPFILTEPVKAWPINKTWTLSRLRERYLETTFRAESVDWPLKTYMSYMQSSRDESPLYLFDRSFVEKMGLEVLPHSPTPDKTHDQLISRGVAYWPHPCFTSDAFTVLGEQRPDHRWLILGPARSGSTFHVDPNGTSAWNAVLRGRKYWIMFPPISNTRGPPPGVHVSADKSEVTTPLSIAEWLLEFHAEARQTPGCVEGTCEEGEVLYVPSGWFHLVVNLEASVAVTQNLVPRCRVGAVLRFLKEQPQSISGFRDGVEDPYALFLEKLKLHDPELAEEGLRELDRLERLGGKWEQLTKGDDADATGGGDFSFGFGGSDDDDDDV